MNTSDTTTKWIVCQRHGYLCDWNGTPKGYNWTRFIKAAHAFPSALAATKACDKIGICAASAVAEMHGI